MESDNVISALHTLLKTHSMIFYSTRIKRNGCLSLYLDSKQIYCVKYTQCHGIIKLTRTVFTFLILTRCTRGDARSFFCTYKTYLYAQNYFLKNIFKYCFKSYIKLHEYANCNSANYDV